MTSPRSNKGSNQYQTAAGSPSPRANVASVSAATHDEVFARPHVDDAAPDTLIVAMASLPISEDPDDAARQSRILIERLLSYPTEAGFDQATERFSLMAETHPQIADESLATLASLRPTGQPA